jgi:hypothetical protein
MNRPGMAGMERKKTMTGDLEFKPKILGFVCNW